MSEHGVDCAAAEALMRGAVIVSRRNGRDDLVAKFKAVTVNQPDAWPRARRAFNEAVWDGSFGRFEISVATDSARELVIDGSSLGMDVDDKIRRFADYLFSQMHEQDEEDEYKEVDEEL